MKKSPESEKKSRKKPIILLILLVVLLAVTVAGIFIFLEYQKRQELKNNPQVATEADNKELVAKVGKLIKLPNETPEVATVSDITKLRDQTLFKNAQNGDKVLIFDKAKRAIVYRPSENVIVEVGNVVVEPDSSPIGASSQAEEVRIVIYNGTNTAGYAKSAGDDLSAKFSNITLAGTENASNDYDETLIVDLTGKNKDFAANLAKELSGEVGSMPSGEVKPSNADILIILGD